jgi:Domain of unknown function (DUF397)
VDRSSAVWHKSTHSGANGCVEVAFVDGNVAVRDSKDRKGPVLRFTIAEWQAFLNGVRDGEFEFPRESPATRAGAGRSDRTPRDAEPPPRAA